MLGEKTPAIKLLRKRETESRDPDGADREQRTLGCRFFGALGAAGVTGWAVGPQQPLAQGRVFAWDVSFGLKVSGKQGFLIYLIDFQL